MNIWIEGANQIEVPIGITGPTLLRLSNDGITPRGVIAAQLMENVGNAFWNSQSWKYKKCDVKIHFSIIFNPKIKPLNYLLVLEPNTTFIRSYIQNWNYGVINILDNRKQTDSTTVDGFVHEFGHLMHLPDEYDNITNKPFTGWEQNIMATVPGVVDQRNIDSIIQNNFNINDLGVCSCSN